MVMFNQLLKKQKKDLASEDDSTLRMFFYLNLYMLGGGRVPHHYPISRSKVMEGGSFEEPKKAQHIYG